jgi:hypothetical protein
MPTLSQARKLRTAHSLAQPGESDFLCSKQLARQLLARLIQGQESPDGVADPIYLFAAEKRGVRITVLPSPKQ